MLQLGQDSNNADNQVPERRRVERVDSFGELLALYLEDEQMANRQDIVDKNSTMFSSDLSSHHDPNPKQESNADLTNRKSDNERFLDACETTRVIHITEDVNKSKSKGLEDQIEMPQVPHVVEQDAKSSSRFEATSAEAELDMLLGSFRETNFFHTPMNQPKVPVSHKPGSSSTNEAPLQHLSIQSAAGFPITSSLDDELDDLLAETSDSSANKNDIFQSTVQVPVSSSLQPSSKPTDLEDFDSWLDTLG